MVGSVKFEGSFSGPSLGCLVSSSFTKSYASFLSSFSVISLNEKGRA